MKCSFCDRDDSVVPCLVAGPPGNNICSECAEKISEGMSNNGKELNESVQCTFCGVVDRRPHGIGVAGEAKICSQCILIALDVVKKEVQTSK